MTMDPEKISRLKIGGQSQIAPMAARSRKKFWTALVLLCIAVFIFTAYERGWLASAIPVRVTTVGWVYPSQVITDFNASGYVVPQRKAAVASKGTGRIEYLAVEEGSRVKEGDTVARLENDDLRAERAQAEAQLSAARSDLLKAQSELETAGKNFLRLRGLYAHNAVAQLEFENAEDRHNKAKAALASAGASVRAYEAAARRAAALLDYTIIRAPFDGVVLTKDADVGEVVAPFGSATNAKAAVVTMADMASLMVHADVAESFLGKVKPAQPCEIQLDSLPDVRFPGKVFAIVPTADRAKGTVLVKVAFDRLDARILPEMSAKAAFLSRPLSQEEGKPFLAVYKGALAEREKTQGIFKIAGERAQWIALSSVSVLGDYLVLTPPMQPGEQVILKPPIDLNSGNRIKVAD